MRFSKDLVIVNAATAKGFMVMEAEGEELVSIRAIKLAISHTHCPFLCLPLKNCKAFSCTAIDPESEFLVI